MSTTTVTIRTATTTCKATYNEIAAQLDLINHQRWFAYVDDADYVMGGGDKVTAIFGGPETGQAAIYRNGANYSYMEKFSYSEYTGKAPAGTVFKIIYLP